MCVSFMDELLEGCSHFEKLLLLLRLCFRAFHHCTTLSQLLEYTTWVSGRGYFCAYNTSALPYVRAYLVFACACAEEMEDKKSELPPSKLGTKEQ